MNDLLEQLAICIERGKSDKNSPYPPDMKDQDGASELTLQLLENGVSADNILQKAMILGMNRIGDRYSEGKAFIPELLIAAKAMNASMQHLKPFFESGEVKHRGTVILGTVEGDLHDIGKNIVRMVLEGDGWKVIDLGSNVPAPDFLDALNNNPDSHVGLSALLTTTMVNMKGIIEQVKKRSGETLVFIGGALVTYDFCSQVGADGYFPDPRSFVKHLAEIK